MFNAYSLHGHVITFIFKVNQILQKKTFNLSFETISGYAETYIWHELAIILHILFIVQAKCRISHH